MCCFLSDKCGDDSVARYHVLVTIGIVLPFQYYIFYIVYTYFQVLTILSNHDLTIVVT